MAILNLSVIGPLIFFAFIFTDENGNWLERRFSVSRQRSLSVLLVYLALNILTPVGFLFYLAKVAIDNVLIFKLKESHLKFFIAYEILLVCFFKYFQKDSLTFLENLGLSYQLLSVIGFAIDRVSSVREEAKQISFFEGVRSMLVPSFYIAGPIEKVQTIAKGLNFPTQLDFNFAVVLIGSGVIKLSLKHFFRYHDLNYGTLFSVLYSSIYFYLDLSAYSDLIQGLSKLMGLKLINNFNLPFLQSSVSSLWRNWHISLYNWFTEYVFEPLVYLRKLRPFSTLVRYSIGVLITFLLIGMWHRVSLNYLIWGSAAAIFVFLEQVLRSKGFKPPRWFLYLGIPYVILTMGILRYITMLPDLTFLSLTSEFRRFTGAHIFNLNWAEEWLLIGLQLVAIVSLSINDFLILKKPQYVTKIGWTLLYAFIASFIYFSMYVPHDHDFSYGRI